MHKTMNISPASYDVKATVNYKIQMLAASSSTRVDPILYTSVVDECTAYLKSRPRSLPEEESSGYQVIFRWNISVFV